MNMTHKRESGVNPERCRHCVRELLQSPLGDREGESAMNEVRRTAFAWNCGSAVHRTCILIAIHRNPVIGKKCVYEESAVAENATAFLCMIQSGNTGKKRKMK